MLHVNSRSRESRAGGRETSILLKPAREHVLNKGSSRGAARSCFQHWGQDWGLVVHQFRGSNRTVPAASGNYGYFHLFTPEPF